MRSRKFKVTLYPLMLASCLGSAVSSQALAGNYFYPPNGFSLPQPVYAGYRFRPVERANDYRHYRPQYSYADAARALYQARLYSGSTRNYRQFLTVKPYRRALPAFTRQFAWSTAQPKGFRRGGNENFYANESNDPVAQSAVNADHPTPVYQSSPVSSQGFRYRTISRNTNYVTFSDRVNAFKPVAYSLPAAAVENVAQAVQTKPVAVERPAVEIKTLKTASSSYFPGQALVKSGNYQFRPDMRFQPQPKPQVAEQLPVNSVNFKLANAQLPATADNPWNNWSFRPADSTF